MTGNILSVVTVGFGLILVIPVVLLSYLNVKNTRYTVTTQRIKVESGALFVTRNQLELHRVRDYDVQEPAYLRRHGFGTITLNTTDKSHPVLRIRGVPDVNALLDKIRTCVRQERQKYRGIDVE